MSGSRSRAARRLLSLATLAAVLLPPLACRAKEAPRSPHAPPPSAPTLTSRIPLASALPRPPGPIAVPNALRTHTAMIEPSGIVWVPSLDRYLVVTDDAGAKDDHHDPWVLAMTRDGAFDDEPVPIRGIKSLNDGESICSGPDGTLFLTTSHSLNKKGKARSARRMLLLLTLHGRALEVLGQVDLTEARGTGGAPLEDVIGVDSTERLDIEAITFREGALLVGLKAPLSARRAAIVLRLASAVAALKAGRIPDGALTRLWEVPLHVSRDGQNTPVAQGIADMTFLPDGSMVLVSNSPKGMPPDGGGSLFWYKPGASEAVLVHRFTGLKPEGVTIAEDGGALVLVFDNDLKAPLWLRWPLQRPVPS